MKKMLKVKRDKDPVMTVDARILKQKRIVYLLVASRPLKYRFGKSRIAYIGSTQLGVVRIAGSAAHRAEEILSAYGVRSMSVYVVWCRQRQGMKTWRYLERAFLALFRARYLANPKCNKQGEPPRFDGRMQKLFKPAGIEQILINFEKPLK